MSLTREEVKHVARLARLELDDAQLDRVTKQLDAILEYVAQIEALSTDDVEPMAHPIALRNVLREDALKPSLPREEALRNAPKQRQGFFEVPRIIQ